MDLNVIFHIHGNPELTDDCIVVFTSLCSVDMM